jgi:arylsulfatase A-like enzyme
MLEILGKAGELDNTLVVVTADNGMPFPRIKGQEYELSNHLPLAMMWKKGINHPGRTVNDFISFIDFAPTFLELAGVIGEQAGMQPITGKSLTNIFRSEKSGTVEPARDRVLFGKERHDVGRPHDEGYPIRAIIKDGYLYIHNFETGRWPAGNPETGYLNCDGSPTKTVILDMRRNGENKEYWRESFGKRPAEELYRIQDDPQCTDNLASNPEVQDVKNALRTQLFQELKDQGDPRMFGLGHVFDEYKYADKSGVGFYERYFEGEKLNSGWVNDSDFEKGPIKAP